MRSDTSCGVFITHDSEAVALAQLFMSDIVMNFGMCSVVVIDDNSTFNIVFILMCKHLKINYWCLSQGNYHGNSVECYHRFLDKTQTISGNDRGTNIVIKQNAKNKSISME